MTTFYLKKPGPGGGEWQRPHFKDEGKRTVMGLWLAQGHTTSGPAQSLRPSPKLSLSPSHPRPCRNGAASLEQRPRGVAAAFFPPPEAG